MKTMKRTAAFVCGLLLLTACGGSRQQQETTTTAVASPTDTTQKKPTGMAAGEAGSLPGWTVVVTGSEQVSQLRDERLSAEIREGETLLLVRARLTNTGPEAASFVGGGANLRKVYLDLGETGRLNAAISMVGQDFYRGEAVAPNATQEGYFVFRLAEKTYQEAGRAWLTIEQGEETISWDLQSLENH